MTNHGLEKTRNVGLVSHATEQFSPSGPSWTRKTLRKIDGEESKADGQ